ncbi:hypothetical protein Tco_0867252 [Tanacetum coccineum]
MSYPHPKRNFIPKAVLMKTGMRPVNAAKPKAAYNAVKINRFNVVKASACWVWMPKNRVVDHVSKNISASVTLKRLDYIDAQGRFKCIGSGEARVQQRKRRIQRRVQQKQKDQKDEVFRRILLAKKMKIYAYDRTPPLSLPLPPPIRSEFDGILPNNLQNGDEMMEDSRIEFLHVNITAVGEKVNAAESLLVVSTEVNAN